MISKKTVLVVVLPVAIAAFVLGTMFQGQTNATGEGRVFSGEVDIDPHAGHDHAPGAHPGENEETHNEGEGTHDWCSEHRVPESECTLCNPGLVDAFKAKNDWCAGHGLPESHCRLCNPGIVFPQEITLHKESQPLGEISIYFPENKVDCSTSEATIRFASAETAERAGLTFEPALESSTPGAIDAPAEIRLDATRTMAVTSTVPVSVITWIAEPGQKVREGEPIARVNSPEIANLKARLIECSVEMTTLQKEYSRKEALRQEGIISDGEWFKLESSLDAAKAKYESAAGLLTSAGLSDSDLEKVKSERAVSPLILLRSPSDGVLVERNAPLGTLIEPGVSLAIISDPHSLWIEARVGERDIRRIKMGQKVEFSSDGITLDKTAGEVIWVSQYLDETTRTGVVRARINIAEPELRAGEYGRLSVLVDDGSKAMLVPRDAVQWEGCCNVVFIREGADTFRPQKVKLAKGDDSHYRVIAGLKNGDMVVVKGSYLLKTELKKSSIGAGCCGLEAET